MKKIIMVLMLMAPMATFAQKFGHVDTQSIMSKVEERLAPQILGRVVQLLLDAQQLVVLGHAVGAGGSAGVLHGSCISARLKAEALNAFFSGHFSRAFI